MSFQIVSATVSDVFINGQRLSLSSTEDKIASFGNLPNAWDCGTGGPIPERTIKIAQSWNEFLQLHEFWDTDAFANGGGEVLIAVKSGDHYFELIIEADDSISVAYDYNRRQVFYRSHMGVLKAQQAVLEIKGRIWTASESSILTSITSGSVNLRALLLKTLERAPAPAYQSWLATAYGQQVSLSVPTSKNIIGAFPVWSGEPQSFGGLIPRWPSLENHTR